MCVFNPKESYMKCYASLHITPSQSISLHFNFSSEFRIQNSEVRIQSSEVSRNTESESECRIQNSEFRIRIQNSETELISDGGECFAPISLYQREFPKYFSSFSILIPIVFDALYDGINTVAVSEREVSN